MPQLSHLCVLVGGEEEGAHRSLFLLVATTNLTILIILWGLII